AASGTASLVFSYVGYTTQTVSVKGSTLDVVLETAAANLNEVVVIGYGTARKKDLTGALSSIKAKDFNQGSITAPDQLLQNKIPGLEITTTSGQPGAATVVKIRGNTSLRAGNTPLYVVDGIPLDGRTARPEATSSFGATATSNPLLYINPNDIAQIDVLKDASSTAIYGSRGANGVIVITTKKANSSGTRVEAGASFSVNTGYMKRFKVLTSSQYREALKKYGLPATNDAGGNVDALDAITQHTISQNYNVALSGGNESGRFRASFLGSSSQGFIKKTSLDKYLGSFGGQYKFLDNRLSIDFNLIAGHYTEDVSSTSNNAGSTGNLISAALNWNPTQPFYDANGLYILNKYGTANPLALNDAYSDKSNVNVFLGSITGGYKIIKDHLEYKLLYGVNHGTGERRINLEGFIVGFPGVSGRGSAVLANARLTSQTLTHTLNYHGHLAPRLTLEAVGGYEYWRSQNDIGGIQASGFNTNLDQTKRIPIPYTNLLTNASNQSPYFTFVNPLSEIQSYFGRTNFNWDDKYFLTGTLRVDGSSKFGKNNKYGLFPSVGAKWQLSNENFLKGSSVLTALSLRASWGITGNQEFPSGASQDQTTLGSYNSATATIVANPNLKWEPTRSINIGTDFTFGKGRLYGSVDYYNKNTTDILFQTNSIQPAPTATYFYNIPANLINKGVEVALGAQIISRKKFGWDVNVSFAYNKNIVTNFRDINTGTPLQINTATVDGQGVSGTLAQVIANDKPVNAYYLKPFKGFDASGNQVVLFDPVYAGDPNPHVIAGFNTTLRYGRFDLAINAGGSFGFLIYNNTATSVTNINSITSGRNIDLAAYNSQEATSSGVAASSRFLEKGDYAKLRNATLHYLIGDAGKYVKNLSVFVSGSNLFVITGFTGFDPEVNIDKTSNAYPSRSIEYIPYPTPRSISVGVNLSL
ncbi:MAG TPA: SusC/RagA family TonB-linked outer membrane protein, partial [Flavisolibacter sp.]|nr:SusC/RagA family TonB-linked outer membrane protein [Flavisolibacter sp.]